MPYRPFTSHKPVREPFFNLPFAIIILAGVLIGLHLWLQYGMDIGSRFYIFWNYGFTPELFRSPYGINNPRFSGFLLFILQFFPFGWDEVPLFAFNLTRLVNYSFLHGDWAHLGLNLIWMVIFGTPLYRRLDMMRFLLFWLLMAALSALTYFAFHINSPIPMIGASGVVSALMGAALRYGFYHGAIGQEFTHPLLPFGQALMNKSAFPLVGVWLLVNLAIGLGTNLPGLEGESIAWEAHIGGLVAGFLLIGLFEREKNSPW